MVSDKDKPTTKPGQKSNMKPEKIDKRAQALRDNLKKRRPVVKKSKE